MKKHTNLSLFFERNRRKILSYETRINTAFLYGISKSTMSALRRFNVTYAERMKERREREREKKGKTLFQLPR